MDLRSQIEIRQGGCHQNKSDSTTEIPLRNVLA